MLQRAIQPTTPMTALASLILLGRLAYAPLTWFACPVLRTNRLGRSIVGIRHLALELESPNGIDIQGCRPVSDAME